MFEFYLNEINTINNIETILKLIYYKIKIKSLILNY